MTAAVPERFADDREPCLAEPFAKVDGSNVFCESLGSLDRCRSRHRFATMD